MNDHQLGASLRNQILADLQRGIPSDGRRLQALAGDLCGERQLPLLPAVRYLVMSQAFASAVGQPQPLPADPRLQLRLQQELEQVFTTAICQRMTAVLQGLLALPSVEQTPASPQMPSPPQPPAPPEAPPVPPPMPAVPVVPMVPAALEEFELLRDPRSYGSSTGSASRGVVAVLSFMAGVLVVGVLAGLVWLWQLSSRQQQALPQGDTTTGTESAPRVPVSPAPAQPPPAPELEQPQQVNPDLAIASVQQLYTDISNGNYDAARQLFSPAASDQFDPTFFGQFQQVSVSDLRETSRSGTSVTLSGVVTYVYPDGTSQTESRSFNVDTATQPALITASSFGSVLKPKG